MQIEFIENIKKLHNTSAEDIRKSQEKYSIVAAICNQVNEKIEALIGDLQDKPHDMLYVIHQLCKINNDIDALSKGEQCQVAFQLGRHASIQTTLQDLDNLLKISNEKKHVDEIAKKIETGDIDIDAKRSPGIRPESIRNLRNAASKVIPGNKKPGPIT